MEVSSEPVQVLSGQQVQGWKDHLQSLSMLRVNERPRGDFYIFGPTSWVDAIV
jgi:hypothetical protein